MVNKSQKELFDSLESTQQKMLWLIVNTAKKDMVDYSLLFTNESSETLDKHLRYLKDKWFVNREYNKNVEYFTINDLELEAYIKTISVEEIYNRQQVLQHIKDKIKDRISQQLNAINQIGLLNLDTGYLKFEYGNLVDQTMQPLED
jgi:hypothetical protein